MASNGNRSISVMTVTISTAVLSTAVMIHLAGPSILRFASSEVPKIYGSMVAWLTPPYLYFVINGIIISIAASSRFHKSGSSNYNIGFGSAPEAASPIVVKQQFVAPPVVVVQPGYVVPAEDPTAYVVPAAVPAAYVLPEEERAAYVAPTEYDSPEQMKEEYVVRAEQSKEEEEEDFVISRSDWTRTQRESTEIPTEYSFLKMEKPLVSSRLGRRKSLKGSPEAGKALGVARPKRNETLESTWKAITDGRPVPLTRHLKKSDTWETHHHATRPSCADDPSPNPAVRKSETFNELRGGGGGGARKQASKSPASSTASPVSAAARLRKEPSMGQDDLNRRVEAFIKKFNEEMRMQRQESLNHYVDMINRGSH